MVEITVYYEKANDYKLITANGAWGGVTSAGDILAEFFVEKISLPNSVVFKVEPPKLAEELETKGGQRHIREIQIGMLLRPDVADSIGHWLIQKAKEAGFK